MEFSGPFCIWSSSVSWFVLVFMVLLEGNSALEDSWDVDAAEAVKNVLLASSESDSSLVIIAENSLLSEIKTFIEVSRSVVLFEAARNGSRLSKVVTHARQVRMESWMVVVVVVIDDPDFLAAFAQQAREGRLLVWATRLIVVSRRVPHSLHPLHQTLALTNSLLLVVDGAAGIARAAGWMVLPYQQPGVAPLRVASWTAGSNLSLHRPLFWDKFSKLSGETNLMVAMERNLKHTVVEEPDSTAPGGVRVLFKGFMVTVVNYLAQGINFSYTFKRPPDGSWGAKIRNGSFTGMLGQVNREEVHFGLGPFGFNAARYEAVDFTWPLSFVDVKVFAGRGSAEVDPWGFLLPLAPWVWTILLSTLLLLSVTSSFLSSKFSQEDLDINEVIASNMLHFVSIMLRQSVWMSKGEWWWQRVVLGVWMLMTMVLMRSYEGNLMSLLAVRHLPQPYQTLRDVVDDPSVVMVWHKQGSPIQSVMDATSGIFHEVKSSEEQGRLMVLPVIKYRSILDEVINQKIVIIDYEKITRATRGEHFSRTGLCDFYMGRENIQAHSVAMISQKDSPLIPSLNTRIISMTEAGLYNYWNNKGIPNYSACEQVPTKITISSSLSLRQCWAIMVILAGGLVVGLFVLTMELLFVGVLRY